jgi:hypothetical protein
MHEALRDDESFALPVQDRTVGDAHVHEFGLSVIAGHIEGPVIVENVMARRIGRNDESGDAPGLARLARRAREHQIGMGARNLAVPALAAVDDPMIAVLHASCFKPRRITAVARFGQAEGEMLLPGDDALDIALLLLGAVVGKRGNDREIADDRRLVLQIVVQAEPLGGEVLADRRDGEVGGGLTTT